MSQSASTAGYAEEAKRLFERYEARNSADVLADFLPWFVTKERAMVLDLGAGTGRDAAFFAQQGHQVMAVEPVDALRLGAAKLHPEPNIEWLDDLLPGLPVVSSRDERFDLVMVQAVWMHLDRDQRAEAMAVLGRLIQPGGRLWMTQRHGPVPAGRQMYDVSGDETVALAKPHGLFCRMNVRTGSVQPENKARAIEWTKLVFELA